MFKKQYIKKKESINIVKISILAQVFFKHKHTYIYLC